jgi:hypothetical protein
VSIHQPIRPLWTCGGCGADWPCPTRQRELLAEFGDDAASLGLYLGALFVTAVTDLPDSRSGDLHRRFLGWVRRRLPAG